MRYVDSGGRDPEAALGHWFNTVLTADVATLRWQTGYFGLEGVGLMLPTVDRLRRSDSLLHAVLGSNDGVTLAADVAALVDSIGVPRTNARLGVVSYARGLYHPKTYHIARRDGTACAYVGSANYSYPAVSGLNIEAGMILDSRDGDSPDLLEAIAKGVDDWFAGGRDGFYGINGSGDVESLRLARVLASVRPERPRNPESDDGDSDSGVAADDERARLHSLITLPRVRPRTSSLSGDATARSAAISEPALLEAPATATTAAAVPRSGFPAYFLFDPDAVAPTAGVAALSGASLPSGAQGLIIQLNRDSGRHFEGRTGTANISIPIATVSTLRFGVRAGTYERPRAEFELRSRFLSASAPIRGVPLATNVMAYGYLEGEPGHKDVRMILPAGIAEIRDRIGTAGFAPPRTGDLALLEWPTMADPSIRLTLLDTSSALYRRVKDVFDVAEAAGRMVGGRATWLPPGISPPW